MTFLEALYGSQYDEIDKRGGDGNRARFNGNLFLSAFIMVILFLAFVVVLKMSASIAGTVNNSISDHFISGKAAGKILAIPLLALIYLVVTRMVGNETNFQKYVDGYLQCPDPEKAKANKQVLVPFIIAVALLFVLCIL